MPTDAAEQSADGSTPDDDPDVPPGSKQTGTPETIDRSVAFGWRGWLLVGIVFVALLVVPAFVLFLPTAYGAIGWLGFSRRQAYILFPMLPAIVLGILAVWTALAAYSESE